MPAISHLLCSRCGHEAYITDHLLFREGKDFVALRHPGERHDLEELGYTESQARREARLFLNEYCVCLDCVSLVTRRCLQRGPRELLPEFSDRAMHVAMCLTAPPLMIATLAFDWPAYAYGPILVAVPLAAGIGAGLRRRHATRAGATAPSASPAEPAGAEFEVRVCAKCGSNRLDGYVRYVLRTRASVGHAVVQCPQCGNLSLRDDPSYMAMA